MLATSIASEDTYWVNWGGNEGEDVVVLVHGVVDLRGHFGA